MKRQMAVSLFLWIARRDSRVAKQVLSYLDDEEIDQLIAAIRAGRFDQKDELDQIYRRIDKALRRNAAAQSEESGDSQVGAIVALSLALALVLGLAAFGERIWDVSASKQVWLTLSGLLLLVPFLYHQAQKRGYFARERLRRLDTLDFFYSWVMGSLFLVALLALLNYLHPVGYAMDLWREPVTGALILLFTVAVGPYVEEVLFRGLIFDFALDLFTDSPPPGGKKDLGRWHSFPLAAAFVLSALAFALVHPWDSPWSLLLYFGSGMILAWQRYQGSSLWLPWLTHALANGVTLVI
jgi:membrane protease YdiL (CAAX protease family)